MVQIVQSMDLPFLVSSGKAIVSISWLRERSDGPKHLDHSKEARGQSSKVSEGMTLHQVIQSAESGNRRAIHETYPKDQPC